ncbi:MAG: phage tail protein, partial [Selenomonas sp.]|nr:phage tail protein [Selenomonas sp.]
MIGQIIQSYLVSLGVQVDKPGFQQADQTIKQTGENVERITGGMARNFVKASTIIGSAIASVTASAVGLMKAAAQEDLAMQKYARSMMMSEDAAWRMKKATDALGESINDIALTPELLGRFTQLTADGSKMKVGGDFKQTMKDFRDLMFEFTRLKQEASYALNWVGYYLMKYLQKPLADIREKFKAFNDS